MTKLDFQSPQPPRIAQWLLTLFTPPDVAESITGDLFEEFSGLVANAGIVAARSWFWRQTSRSIVHSGANSFRAAPWLMLVAVMGGFWLVGFASRSSVHAMQVFLDSHRIYESHPDAYLFWIKFPLQIGRVILCTVIGSLIALVAKRMEMIAVTALVLVQTTLFLAAAIALIVSGREWFHWFLVMLLWNGLSSIAIILGGVIVRTHRSVTKTGHSAA